jgi:hypothetical protein
VKKHLNIKNLSWLIVILVGMILCIRELREPDLWWQLRTGEWMLENMEITRSDMFSFTHNAVPWINVKWGYEVILAAISNTIGPEGVMILQMLSVLSIILFLFKAQKIFSKEKQNVAGGIIFSLIVFLIIHASRINGRPEMTTYALTTVYLYLFVRYYTNSDKSIFWLIPIQIFWTNMHEAYGVGVIMITLFSFSVIVQNYLSKKGGIKATGVNIKRLIVVNVLLLGTLAVNPNGFEMLGHYLEIYSQLQENKFTTENYSFRTEEYWTYASTLNLVLFLITIYQLFLKGQKGNVVKGGIESINRYGLWYIMLYFAFFYLSLQATRNTFFFTCISFPIYCSAFSNTISSNFKTERGGLKFATVVGVLFYLGIGSGLFYKTFLEREQYGLKISSKRNAIGAANFLKEHNISGNGFVDYLNSSYLLWEMQPDFKTYLDLRDLDIFPQQFMEAVFISYEYPAADMGGGVALWDKMVEEDSFSFVVVSNNQQFGNFHRFLTHDNDNYELVYADGVASLYLPRTEENKKTIETFGYNKGKKDVFRDFTPVKSRGVAKVLTRIFWPFYTEHEVSDKEERLTKIAYYRMLSTI